jgi:hypothetical protein
MSARARNSLLIVFAVAVGLVIALSVLAWVFMSPGAQAAPALTWTYPITKPLPERFELWAGEAYYIVTPAACILKTVRRTRIGAEEPIRWDCRWEFPLARKDFSWRLRECTGALCKAFRWEVNLWCGGTSGSGCPCWYLRAEEGCTTPRPTP